MVLRDGQQRVDPLFERPGEVLERVGGLVFKGRGWIPREEDGDVLVVCGFPILL